MLFFLVGLEQLQVTGDGAAAGLVEVFLFGGQGDDLKGGGDACVGAQDQDFDYSLHKHIPMSMIAKLPLFPDIAEVYSYLCS